MHRKTFDKGSRIESAARRTSLLSPDDAGRFDELVAELATAFVRASLPQIDEEINRALKRIALMLGLDRSTIAEFRADGVAFFSHGWVRDAHFAVIGKSLDVNALLPWTEPGCLLGRRL